MSLDNSSNQTRLNGNRDGGSNGGEKKPKSKMSVAEKIARRTEKKYNLEGRGNQNGDVIYPQKVEPTSAAKLGGPQRIH